jgi:nucleotide-binding universal stress UspA family protein
MADIVVGVDGSDGSAHALRFAVAEGALRGWDVQAVLAWGFLDQHHPSTMHEFDPGYVAADAEAALRSYVEAAVGAEAATRIDLRAVSDLPVRALEQASKRAALLVVGARGLGGFGGLLLGSISQACLRHALCPVAVIRPPSADEPSAQSSRVVVGIDGSPTAHEALVWAIGEAVARHAQLEVVHAWQPPFIGGYPFTAAAVDYTMFEDAASSLMDHALAAVDCSSLEQPPERTILCAGAASALLDAADRSDLVVVGTRGLSGLHRLLVGSVSHQVATHAHRPVVVVPPPPED